MLPKESPWNRTATLVLLVFGMLLGEAWAQTETVLYNFCQENNCLDGASPSAPVVFDQKGNLYGTTPYGGEETGGTVFKLTADGQETVLSSFCLQTNCADGAQPSSGLLFDHKGNLYGTTVSGGASFFGTVYKVTPAGVKKILYSFCAESNCGDGNDPAGGLAFDQKGNLYGATVDGGILNNCYLGCGVVFKLTPQGKETVLYRFCAETNCTDGEFPLGGVVIDKKGNLYGTVYQGGAQGFGAVFKLTPEGKETVLHSFGATGDGKFPEAGLVFDQNGNLYGTTYQGGAHDYGTVFKLTPAGEETVLYSFCARKNCADGEGPQAGLVFDQKGSLYGTTLGGGIQLHGTVFKLTPEGHEKVLYSFCLQAGCPDGANPSAALIFDQTGNLYGTTTGGGLTNDTCSIGCGTVFKITPHSGAR